MCTNVLITSYIITPHDPSNNLALTITENEEILRLLT